MILRQGYFAYAKQLYRGGRIQDCCYSKRSSFQSRTDVRGVGKTGKGTWLWVGFGYGFGFAEDIDWVSRRNVPLRKVTLLWGDKGIIARVEDNPKARYGYWRDVEELWEETHCFVDHGFTLHLHSSM